MMMERLTLAARGQRDPRTSSFATRHAYAWLRHIAIANSRLILGT
ncbi:hypothetical protein [Methylobacterium sp. WL103]|nr:hypothetical protein [Methylobacterium sp. WL103]